MKSSHKQDSSRQTGTAARFGRIHHLACILGAGFMISLPLSAQDEPPAVSHDGLTLQEDTEADAVYLLPEADFSVYDSFYILEPSVAFKKNWQRDFNRTTSQRRVTDADMQEIIDGMKATFLEVFVEELTDEGYPVVEETGPNVMILRPAIVDLDVNAPDLPAAGRSRSFVTTAGSAIVYLEFFDSITGQILARAVDYQQARDTGSFQWATSVSNRAEARAVIRRWANMLVDRLDEIHAGDEDDD